MEGLTDLELTAHLVMGEWIVLVRGRLYGRHDMDRWDDLLRVQLDLDCGPDEDPHNVLCQILSAIVV